MITSRNVNGAFHTAWWRFKTGAVEEDSRNGPVLVMADPVLTTYMRPTERVLFDDRRDANPVFHLVEALWMLAGRDEVKFILPFNSRYDQYAESDGTVHGAYGARWRQTFGMDQILAVIDILKRDPNSRQAVIQMWSSDIDLGADVKDKPCNTHIYFDGRQGRLNMTVCCRSNDMLWGAYGANVVHFSMLQELIAWGTGLAIGEYRQFSNNFHVYTDLPMVREFLRDPPEMDDPYAGSAVIATPMFVGDETVQDFLLDCGEMFLEERLTPRTVFFRDTAWPLVDAYIARKVGLSVKPSMEFITDWHVAFSTWVARRDEPGHG